MIKIKNTLLCLAASALACFGLGTFFSHTDNVAALEMSQELFSEYSYNETFTSPSAVITKDGQEKNASSYLIYPNGTVSYDSTNLLSASGKYRLVYYADFDGKTVSESHTFTVNDELYTLKGNGSYAYYENYAKLDGASGLEVTLCAGDVFTFNQLIDVKDMTRENSLCEVVNLPEEVYKRNEYKRFFMVLNDSLDPNNQVIIRYRNPSINFRQEPIWDDYRMCVLAGTTMENLSDGTKTFGADYLWGVYIDASMYGLSSDGKPLTEHSMDFYFDYERKIIFGNDINSSINGQIVDIDDPAVFPEIWSGFKSGKARLSFYADELQTSSVKFFVEKASNFDLSQNVVKEDGEGPEIYYSGDLNTQGIINNKYYFAEVTALDLYDGEYYEVKKTVYRNYYSNNKINVNSDAEGFIPNSTGIFTVEYCATDLFGNATRLTVDVNVLSHIEDISINANIAESYPVGKYIRLPECFVENTCGQNIIDISITNNGQEVEFNKKDGCFLPVKTGNYTLSYTVMDALKRTATKDFQLNVVANENVEIYDDFEEIIPDNFLLGFEYELPVLTGYWYNNNTVEEKVAQIKVSNGVVEGNIFQAGSEGTVAIEYYFETGKPVATYTRPVYDVFENETISVKKYFLTNSLSVDYNDKSYIAITGNADGTAQFVNELKMFDFELRFKIKGANFQKVQIILQDKDTAIIVEFFVSLDKLCYSVNGLGKVSLFSVIKEQEISVVYDNENNRIAINGRWTPILTDASGMSFTGFKKGMATLNFAINGVDSAIEQKPVIELNSINSQLMKNIESDSIRPDITFLDDYGGMYDLGEIAILPSCLVTDVLSPVYTSLRVSVKNNTTGTFATAEDGTLLKDVEAKRYAIKFSEYGSYLVTYSVYDGFGNIRRVTFNYFIMDTTEPEAALKDGFKFAGCVGDEIKLAEYQASDNYSQTLSCKIFLVKPDYSWVMLADDTKKISLDMEGVYKVFYVISDEAGNNIMLEYVITAEVRNEK